MEPRLIVAYVLMLLMVLFAGALVGYRMYHSHRRSYSRRMRREACEEQRRKLERGQPRED